MGENTTHARLLLPILTTLLVMGVFPYLLPFNWQMIAPPLGFGMLYFWRFYESFSIWAAVLCGLLLDMLQLMPVGIGISAALLLYAFSKPRKEPENDTPRSFAKRWLLFSGLSFVVLCWIYLLMSLTAQTLFTPLPALFQWLALVAIYPLIHRLCFALLQHINPNFAKRS